MSIKEETMNTEPETEKRSNAIQDRALQVGLPKSDQANEYDQVTLNLTSEENEKLAKLSEFFGVSLETTINMAIKSIIYDYKTTEGGVEKLKINQNKLSSNPDLTVKKIHRKVQLDDKTLSTLEEVKINTANDNIEHCAIAGINQLYEINFEKYLLLKTP